MKRPTAAFFVIVVVFSVVCSSVHAGSVSGGMKVGLNLANLHGSDVEESDLKTGFCAGGFVAFNITDMFVIQPELLYTQKGDKFEVGTVKAWTILDYLEIPILAKLSIPTKGTVTPNLFLGPAVAFKIRSKGRLEVEGVSIEVSPQYNNVSVSQIRNVR